MQGLVVDGGRSCRPASHAAATVQFLGPQLHAYPSQATYLGWQRHRKRPCEVGRRRGGLAFSSAASSDGGTWQGSSGNINPQGEPQASNPTPPKPQQQSASSTPGKESFWQGLSKFLDQQIIPVALITMMVVGSCQPAWGMAAAKAGLSKAITIAIFIVAGLQLRRGEALAALKAPSAVLFGLASILFVTPLLAGALLALPLPPNFAPLALGTAVFCCMPTTLSSGISMTTAVGGNTALAVLLTISSNALGVATMPLLMPLLLGAQVGGVLQPLPLLIQLIETVLAPTLLGVALRAWVPGVAAAVDGHKKVVVYFSAACLASVPWMQVSQAVGKGLRITPGDLALAALLGAMAHGAFLAFNWLASGVLRLGSSSGGAGGGCDVLEGARLRQALVLQASQKTLPVAIAVISGALAERLASMGPAAGGLAAISAVAAHLAQVIMDSLLLPVWTRYIQQAKAAAAAAAAKSA